MGCLYQLTFPSGKSYIGITMEEFDNRIYRHLHNAKYGAKHFLSKAIRKYGDVFTRKVLVIANNWEYLCELEKKAIEIYNTFNPNGYNQTKGGEGVIGYKHTEETLKKMSLFQKSKKASPETLEKMSKSQTGKKMSTESRIKMSLAQTGRVTSEETKIKISNSNKGRITSEETKAKISASKIGITFTESTRKKISDANKGLKWFNNGEKNTKARECPDGFVAGRLNLASRS